MKPLYNGNSLLEPLYWNLSIGTSLLEPLYWNLSIGTSLLEPLYWNRLKCPDYRGVLM